jgi:hypothetical protein
MQWDAMGCNGMQWDAMGCMGWKKKRLYTEARGGLDTAPVLTCTEEAEEEK